MCAFGCCIFSPFALDFVTICLSIFHFSIKMKELYVWRKSNFWRKNKLLHKLFSMQSTSQICRCMYGISFCLLHYFFSIFIIYISYCFAIVSICRLFNALHLPTASVVHFSCDSSTTHRLNSTKVEKINARNDGKMKRKT